MTNPRAKPLSCLLSGQIENKKDACAPEVVGSGHLTDFSGAGNIPDHQLELGVLNAEGLFADDDTDRALILVGEAIVYKPFYQRRLAHTEITD